MLHTVFHHVLSLAVALVTLDADTVVQFGVIRDGRDIYKHIILDAIIRLFLVKLCYSHFFWVKIFVSFEIILLVASKTVADLDLVLLFVDSIVIIANEDTLTALHNVAVSFSYELFCLFVNFCLCFFSPLISILEISYHIVFLLVWRKTIPAKDG